MGPAERLVRNIVHHAVPALILDEYRNVLSKSYPTLKEFIDNVSRIVTKLQDKSELATNTKSSQKAPAFSTIPAEECINIVGVQKDKKQGAKKFAKKQCLFCGSERHLASLCTLFITLESRKHAFLQKYDKTGCQKCILEHPKGSSCMECQTEGCPDKTEHGTLACPCKLAIAERNKLQLENAKTFNIKNINRMRAVALPTAMVLIESSVKDVSLKSASILLDTAAQQTLIHRKIVDDLQLKPIGREFTSLIGFGQTKPKPQYYDMVRLTLYKPGFSGKVRVTALVVDKPPSVCTMTGICLFAKRIQKLGVKLADSRLLNQKSDVLTSDVLVGMD